MDHHLLFRLLNATPATPHWQIAGASIEARWLILVVPAAMVWCWIRGSDEDRRGLLEMLLATLLALAIAQVVNRVWPEPRPFMIHMGYQFLAHDPDPGLPSDHVTVLWSVAFASLLSPRFATWCVPLFALGLVVGCSRVFLGIHFPLDIAAALPVALVGVLAVWVVRSPMAPAYAALVRLWFRLERRIRTGQPP